MKILYLLIGGIIHSLLAQTLPYVIKIGAACIYLIGCLIGYYDGSDSRGEEGVIVILLPLTLFAIAIFLAILIVSNQAIFRKVEMRKSRYVIFSVASFVLFFSLSMLVFDPPNLT